MANTAAWQEAANRAGTLKMIVDKLFRVLRRRFRCFPDNYLVLDLETTGLDKSGEDLIGQIGHCLVVGRTPVETKGVVLNWVGHAGIRPDWLARRLADTRQNVEYDRRTGRPNGRRYHLSVDRMLSEGVSPVVALAACLDMVRKAREERMFVILHNGYSFDCPFLENAFRRYLGADWRFNDDEVFDTGMVERASQLNLLPWNEESLRAFSVRIGRQMAKGVRWALDSHCVPKYDLAQKYGFDPGRMHEGGLDCLVTHYLFEEFRRLSGEGGDAPRQHVQGPVGLGGVGPAFDPFPPDPGD